MKHAVLWVVTIGLLSTTSFADNEKSNAQQMYEETIPELQAAIDAVREAETTWRSRFVGKVTDRAGRPLSEKELMRPVDAARRTVGELSTRLKADAAEFEIDETRPDAFMTQLDQVFEDAVVAEWTLALDETRLAVELAQRAFDDQVREAEEEFGAGNKAKLRPIVETARTEAIEALDGLGQGLSKRREALFTRVNTRVERAQSRGWRDGEAMGAALLETHLNVAPTSRADGRRQPSALDLFLTDNELFFRGVDGDRERRRHSMKKWFAFYDVAEVDDVPDEAPAYPEFRIFFTPRLVAGYAIQRPHVRNDGNGPWHGFLEPELAREVGMNGRLLLFYGVGIVGDDGQVAIESDDDRITYRVLGASQGPMDPFELPRDEPNGDAWIGPWRDLIRDQPLRALDELVGADKCLVLAELEPGTMPGEKRLMANGVTARWVLPRGNVSAGVDIVRQVGDDEWEPLQYVFSHDRVQVEVRVSDPVDLDELYVALATRPTPEKKPLTKEDLKAGRVRSDNGGFEPLEIDGETELVARRDPNDPTVYRTDKIHIRQAGRRINKPEDGVHFVVIEPGSDLLARLPHGEPVNPLYPSLVKVVHKPADVGMHWKQALWDAAKLSGIDVTDWQTMSDSEAGEIVNYEFGLEIKWESVELKKRKVKVTVGDHAALLLMRDKFIQLMKDVRQEMGVINELVQEDDWFAGAYHHMLAPRMKEESFPFRYIQVDMPGNAMVNPDVDFAKSFDEEYLNEWVPLTSWRGNYQRQATREALNTYVDAIDEAIEEAEDIEDDDLEDLVKFVGLGFGPVINFVKPNMLRLSDPSTGRLMWEPDKEARAIVRSIQSLGLEVRANEDLVDIERQVVLCVASLGMLGPEILALRVVGAGIAAMFAADALFIELPDYLERNAEFRIALGTSALGGDPEFLEIMAARRLPGWAVLVNVVGSALGVGGEFLRLVSVMRVARATRQIDARSETIFKAIGEGRWGDWRGLSADDQAAIAAALADAMKAEQRGAAAMSQNQRRLLQAYRDVAPAIRREELINTIRPLANWPEAGTLTKGLSPTRRSLADKIPKGYPPADGGGVTYIHIAEDGTRHTYEVGQILGAGRHQVVYALKNHDDLVIKLLKVDEAAITPAARTGETSTAAAAMRASKTPGAILQRARRANRWLKRHGVRQLEIVNFAPDGTPPYVVQRRLRPGMRTCKYRYGIVDWEKADFSLQVDLNTLTPAQLEELHRAGKINPIRGVVGVEGEPLTRGQQRAALRLFKKLGAPSEEFPAGLIFEDSHIENIYFEKVGLRWEAGILDHDRLAPFDSNIFQLDPTMEGMVAYVAYGRNVESLRGATGRDVLLAAEIGAKQRILPDADFFMEKMLEYDRRYIHYDRHTKEWTGILLDMDLVEQYFPNIRQNADPDLLKMHPTVGK